VGERERGRGGMAGVWVRECVWTRRRARYFGLLIYDLVFWITGSFLGVGVRGYLELEDKVQDGISRLMRMAFYRTM
jgi:hypothetical protein